MRMLHGRRLFIVAKTVSDGLKRHTRMQAVARGWLCRRRLEHQREFDATVQEYEPLYSAFKAAWRARNARRDHPAVMSLQCGRGG